jgi:hypothetical protein
MATRSVADRAAFPFDVPVRGDLRGMEAGCRRQPQETMTMFQRFLPDRTIRVPGAAGE